MCEHGRTTEVVVRIPPELSNTGEPLWVAKPIDSCIARIVEALNEGGVRTIASCCGHGRAPGSIVLEDGRELLVRRSDVDQSDGGS